MQKSPHYRVFQEMLNMGKLEGLLDHWIAFAETEGIVLATKPKGKFYEERNNSMQNILKNIDYQGTMFIYVPRNDLNLYRKAGKRA